MRHGTLTDDLVGTLRDRQGWIGGYNPQTAAYVPPPPELVPALVDDLLTYINGPAPDAVTQAAQPLQRSETKMEKMPPPPGFRFSGVAKMALVF